MQTRNWWIIATEYEHEHALPERPEKNILHSEEEPKNID